MNHKTTYKKITAKIIFISLSITLAAAFLYGEYLKQSAMTTLGKADAKKTSMLVFESLYTAMERGWTKKDLQAIITRLNNVDPTLKVNITRGDIVAGQFGDIEKDRYRRQTVSQIQRAFKGEELLEIHNEELIDFYYPIAAKADCLKCHTSAKPGDILGVIDITYPVTELKVSLTQMINFFILFIIFFSVIIFIALFLEFDKYLIKPIKNFIAVTQSITSSNDITKRVHFDDDIEEMCSMRDVFNGMLDSIEHQFYHDSLTGLANRRRLTERLETHKEVLLMILNIDAFQEVNDLYGEETGDRLLKAFAFYLGELLPKNALLYRLHSDEFAYLCTETMDLHEFETLAAFIINSVAQQSFIVDDSSSDINLSVTIGISHGSAMLLANADIALTLAKKNKKHYLVFDESMQLTQEYEKNFAWTKRLKRAIEQDRIVPLFQPIANSHDEKIVKYECLMRIVDDNGDYIAPIHFLELAKKNKLYHQLTKIMIEKSFNTFHNEPFRFSINLSVEDIINEDVVALIMKKLQETDTGERVVFEIIESEGIENFEQVIAFINDVKTYGAQIAIDDFGTGYSNFEYLMKLRVDYIKIDASMIKQIDIDTDAQMITQTIVDFAKRMGIKTVGEFVYSKSVFEKVKSLGVDYVQGYYIGKPAREIRRD